MDSIVRQGDAFFLHTCWGPPQRLYLVKGNPLLTKGVLAAVAWLKAHPEMRMRIVGALP